METERSQKELFEFEAPKRTAPRFNNIFQKTDFAVSLGPEKIVFIIIGILMLMVIFFALGVEKGKAIAARQSTIRASVVTAVQPVVSQIPVKPGVPQIKTVAPSNITPKNIAAPYTIVTGAFTRQDFASQEVAKLKASGLEAFIYYVQPHYLACIGSFASRESAQKVLNRVRQVRRDAYVRLR